MEKGPKTLIKSSGLYSHRTIGNARFTPRKCYKTSISKQIRKIFNPMAIDLLAILEKSLDRALFLYIFIPEVRSSGIRASITVVHIRKFYEV